MRGAMARPGVARRYWVILGAAVVHLGLAIGGAAESDFDGPKGLISTYAALSGADSGYGFFAPAVGTQLRLLFHVVDEQGNRTSDVLETGVSHEADVRVGDLIAVFWLKDQELQRALAGSWAGRMFGRHPEAQKIVVHLDAYDLPDMDEYRAGRRPGWEPYYEASFVRRAEP
jgi:hypothetical protein